MSEGYVRRTYGVGYKRGDRLTVKGRPGTLVSFPGQYLGVRFDGEKLTSRCHPTWEVERLTPQTNCTRPHDNEPRETAQNCPLHSQEDRKP